MSVRIRASLVVATLVGAVLWVPSPASGVAGFGDVGASEFYTEAVQWMVDNDITTGTSATCFSPGDPVTRGQAAAFMWRMEGEPSAPAHSFSDVVASWQQGPVSWMAANGITTGTTASTYSPDDVLTRGQLAALLWRLAGNPAAPPHAFSDVTASWQQGPVSWMASTTPVITTGTSSTTFSPDDTVTRGQLATFFHRYKGEPAVTIDPAHPTSPACDQQVPAPTTTTTLPGSGTTTTSLPPSSSSFEIIYRSASYLCVSIYSTFYDYDCVRYYGGSTPSFLFPDLYCSGDQVAPECVEYDPEEYFEVRFDGAGYLCRDELLSYGEYECELYLGGPPPYFFTPDLYCSGTRSSPTCSEYDPDEYFEVTYGFDNYICEDTLGYEQYDCVHYYGGPAPYIGTADLYCSGPRYSLDCSPDWYPDELDNYEYVTIDFASYACEYQWISNEFNCVRYFGGRPPTSYFFPDYICDADYLGRLTSPCIKQ